MASANRQAFGPAVIRMVVRVDLESVWRSVCGGTSLFDQHVPEVFCCHSIIRKPEGHANNGNGFQHLGFGGLSVRRVIKRYKCLKEKL